MQATNPKRPKKRPADNEINVPMRKTRGLYLDFKRFDNPFSDKEDEDTMITIQIMIYDESYITATSDGLMSLKQAKDSADWPEWEKAIVIELKQLQAEGTWELIDKPPNAIPIANKWVFVKKMDKLGILIANKARLVIKGCVQHPGFDYIEIYSLVVHIETVCTILAMVPKLDLRVHQIDIKGAYIYAPTRRVYQWNRQSL